MYNLVANLTLKPHFVTKSHLIITYFNIRQKLLLSISFSSTALQYYLNLTGFQPCSAKIQHP